MPRLAHHRDDDDPEMGQEPRPVHRPFIYESGKVARDREAQVFGPAFYMIHVVYREAGRAAVAMDAPGAVGPVKGRERVFPRPPPLLIEPLVESVRRATGEQRNVVQRAWGLGEERPRPVSGIGGLPGTPPRAGTGAPGRCCRRRRRRCRRARGSAPRRRRGLREGTVRGYARVEIQAAGQARPILEIHVGHDPGTGSQIQQHRGRIEMIEHLRPEQAIVPMIGECRIEVPVQPGRGLACS